MNGDASSADSLRDSVVQALGRLPSVLPSPDQAGELKQALVDLASIRATVSRADFPGLPKPRTTADSLAPLPLVSMISAPKVEPAAKAEQDTVDVKMEAAQEDVSAVAADKEEMQID